MRDLDEIDLEIVRLLLEDGRRPYSDIADRVGLSPPAVSDRIDRLRDQGVVRGFTVDVDRTAFADRVPVLVTIEPDPAALERVYDAVDGLEGTEHVFRLFDGSIVAYANAPERDASAWLREGVPMDDVSSYDAKLVTDVDWTVDVTASDFALSCALCDNAVGSDGVTTRVGDEVKAFCCPTCEGTYVERYESHREDAR